MSPPNDLISHFTQSYFLFTATLLDIAVHMAPDDLLGDGGSLYLIKPEPPESKKKSFCSGCQVGNSNECCRAYLVASTRDHPRVEIGESFYCINKEKYIEAGEHVDREMSRPLSKIHTVLKEFLDTLLNDQGLTGKTVEAKVNTLLTNLLKSKETEDSALTNQIRKTLGDTDAGSEPKKRSVFDAGAAIFLERLSKSKKAQPRAVNRRLERSLHTLHRCINNMVSISPNGAQPSNELTSEKNAFIWELMKCHDLLRELYEKYLNGFQNIRASYPALGLSGWAAAFGLPVRLRNIENPFDIMDYVKPQSKEEENLPLPLWGDRARGHKDRLEREGRPFLGVPVVKESSGDSPPEILGFLRVATKREGERYFTDEDLRKLQGIASLIAKFLADYKPSMSSEQQWWLSYLYGAIKGKAFKELGDIAAESFLHVFNSSAVSIFLREDLWIDQVEAGINENEVEKPTPDAKSELTGRPYKLWGTAIDKNVYNNTPKVKETFDQFVQARATQNYREKEGKTGWVLRIRAAVLARYIKNGKRNECEIHLSPSQVIRTYRQGSRRTTEMPGTPLMRDPSELKELVEKFRKKEQTPDHKCEIDHKDHSGFLVVPLIDPDSSPEPLGAIRFIFTTNDQNPVVPLASDLMVHAIQLSRSFVRLLRQRFFVRRLLRTFSELVSQSAEYFHDTRDQALPSLAVVKKAYGGVSLYGPYGRVAASLLSISETSAVSIFVKNCYAPRAFRKFPENDESWVLVGAAAAIDAMTDADREHFQHAFCRTYLIDQKGACRYRKGEGRTGKALEEGTTQRIEPANDTEKSNLMCEVQSPNALLLVPASKIETLGKDKKNVMASDSAKGIKEDSVKPPGNDKKNVIALARFVRTEERRRAKFIQEEEERLETIIQTLSSLVPAWSKQDEFHEFKQAWQIEIDRVFPKELLDLLKTAIFNLHKQNPYSEHLALAQNEFKDKDEDQVIDWYANRVPQWALTGERIDPESQSAREIFNGELSILAWFLCKLRAPSPETSLPTLITSVVRSLLTLHWGVLSTAWVERLKRLERFEPVLSEIPRYRDHCVHQFQVYIIGWLLMNRIRQLIDLKIGYRGWDQRGLQRSQQEQLVIGKNTTTLVQIDSVSANYINASEWVLASVFHDVAYPLERVHKWANIFGEALTSAAGNYVKKGEAAQFFADLPDAKAPQQPATPNTASQSKDSTQERINFDHWRDLLAKKIGNLIPDSSSPKDSPGPSAQTLQDVTEALNSCIKDWDHGVWAALVLLSSNDEIPEITNAATAIALHNSMLPKLQALKLSIDLTTNKALVFLLLLSDCLHEWGRDFWRSSQSEIRFDELARRPSFIRLSINEKDQLKTITIDLAMGQDCTALALEDKKKELEALMKILFPGDDLNIFVRIARNDPRDIDPAGKDKSEFAFRAGVPS